MEERIARCVVGVLGMILVVWKRADRCWIPGPPEDTYIGRMRRFRLLISTYY